MARKETTKEREKKKWAFVSRALNKAKGMMDETKLIKEAAAMFDERFPPKKL